MDGDGHLSSEELRSLFDKMGRKLSEKKFKKAFKKMDQDGDGHVDYSEFCDWWLEQSEQDFNNFRHFEEYTDDASSVSVELEAKMKEFELLSKQMLKEMPNLDLDMDLPGGVDGTALAGGAAAGALALGITIPAMGFQTDGLKEAFASFHEQLLKTKGIVAEKAQEIGIHPDMTLTEIMRAFSQLLQVKVIELARLKIVPLIDKAVESADLPGLLIQKKVKLLVYEMAEKEVRKFVHDTVKESFKKATTSCSVPGCDVDVSPVGDEDGDIDASGYLKSLGGYKAAEFGLSTEPISANKYSDYINRVIDPTLMQQVKENLGIVGEMLVAYAEKAASSAQAWVRSFPATPLSAQSCCGLLQFLRHAC